jgi:hypothetical protein
MLQYSTAAGEFPLPPARSRIPAMSDFFSRLSGHDVIPIVVLLIVFGSFVIVSLAVIIATCVHKIRRDEANAQLKHDMLNRGMSADEIKTVLEAGTKSGK